MATTLVNLNDAVNAAFKAEEDKVDGTLVEETAAETKVESVVEETDADKLKAEKAKADAQLVDTQTLEVETTPEEIRNAINLLRTLSNPETAQATFEMLAKQGGYDLTKKAEVKQLVRDSKTVLREKLGDAYDVLGGEKLAEAFDEILADRVSKATKPLEDNARLAAQQANEQKADMAMKAFFTRNEISTDNAVREELASKMMAKMQKLPPAQGIDVNEYLDDIYTVVGKLEEPAVAKTKQTEMTTEVAKRINKNLKEKIPSAEGSGVDDHRVKQGSKKPSLDESVRAAFEGKTFDFD